MARQITNAKPQDMMKTLSSFKKYIGYHKYALSCVAVLVIISTGINLWGTFQIRTVINQYLMPGDYQGLVRFIIFMIVVYMIGATSTAIYKQLMVHTSQKIVKEMRQDLFDKTQKLPIQYFDSHTHGEVMSHFTNDLDTVQDALNNCLIEKTSDNGYIAYIFNAEQNNIQIGDYYFENTTSVLVKFNANSEIEWASEYNLQNTDITAGNSTTETIDKGFAVVGYFERKCKNWRL